MHLHIQGKNEITKNLKVHLTLVEVNVEIRVEAVVCMECAFEVEEPPSSFSDSQKKTGQNYFAKSLLYFISSKKFKSHGYP